MTMFTLWMILAAKATPTPQPVLVPITRHVPARGHAQPRPGSKR